MLLMHAPSLVLLSPSFFSPTPTASMISVLIWITSFLLLIRFVFSIRSILYLLRRLWIRLDDGCQAYQVYKVPRFGGTEQENPLFRRALVYLNSLPSLEDSDRANLLSTGRKPNEFFLQLDPDAPVPDSFLGSRLSWTLVEGPVQSLLLRIRRDDRHRVLRPYLQHVEAVADDIDLRRKEVRLYSVSSNGWNYVPLTHPATLDTVAVDAELKTRVKNDLESFLKGKSYYARLGRVWKRSYLLYGPPGTGKSTFVAAMAKFLNYDVYDLDMSRVAKGGIDLKTLLVRTSPRSVILVEDFDRYEAAASMMGFMDGVFSCCGEERVMVFTTSQGKDAVDPAMLRPGRLDVHIHFPLCDFSAFKTLASSYLGLKDHKLYPQVEEGFQNGAKLSPAQVGEIMIANRGSPTRALKTVINVLNRSSSGKFYSGSLRKTMSESVSIETSRLVDTIEGCGGGHGLGFGKDATVRELKKLYGLIRTRGSGSRKEGTMSVQMAAAAAATANAAAAANAANYLDRSFDRELSL